MVDDDLVVVADPKFEPRSTRDDQAEETRDAATFSHLDSNTVSRDFGLRQGSTTNELEPSAEASKEFEEFVTLNGASRDTYHRETLSTSMFFASPRAGQEFRVAAWKMRNSENSAALKDLLRRRRDNQRSIMPRNRPTVTTTLKAFQTSSNWLTRGLDSSKMIEEEPSMPTSPAVKISARQTLPVLQQSFQDRFRSTYLKPRSTGRHNVTLAPLSPKEMNRNPLLVPKMTVVSSARVRRSLRP